MSLKIKFLTDENYGINCAKKSMSAITINIEIVYLREVVAFSLGGGWNLCHNYDQDGNHLLKNIWEK